MAKRTLGDAWAECERQTGRVAKTLVPEEHICRLESVADAVTSVVHGGGDTGN